MWIEWPALYLRHGDVISIHEGCNRHDGYSLNKHVLHGFLRPYYGPNMFLDGFLRKDEKFLSLDEIPVKKMKIKVTMLPAKSG